MRTIISAILLLFAFTGAAQAKSVKTETILVSGNCEECKERIENAADIKGVKISKWDDKSGVATVTYDPEKTTLLKIKQAIAAQGHDAGEVKAGEKSYNKLPGCCKYRDRKCEEPKGK
jgi:periplasmic mercuric ion binding protein